MTHPTDQLDRRRQERLVREIAQRLRRFRSFTMSADAIEDIDGVAWRGPRRRRLGISIRTGVSRDGERVWASEGP